MLHRGVEMEKQDCRKLSSERGMRIIPTSHWWEEYSTAKNYESKVVDNDSHELPGKYGEI